MNWLFDQVVLTGRWVTRHRNAPPRPPALFWIVVAFLVLLLLW